MANGFDVRGRLLDAGELAVWLAEHSLGNRFGLAVHGADPAQPQTALAVAIVAADGDGRYIDTLTLAEDDEAALASWLADPGPPKAAHDVKRAMHALARFGWTLRGVTSDTALAAYLLRPEQPSLALNDLLVHHMRCALPTEVVTQLGLSSPYGPGGPTEQDVGGLILTACAVLDLADVLDEELARIDSSSVLSRLELPAARTLAEMEATGIAVDRNRLSDNTSLNSIGPDGRIHPTFHQIGAANGRIWSSNPDLDDLGFRNALVAGEGYTQLMTARYRDLEARIIAHVSGDAGAVDALVLGDESLDLSALLKEAVQGARETGYCSTLLGRRHYLPNLSSDNPTLRETAESTAIRFLVAGSAADIVKMAMIKVNQLIKDAGLHSRLLIQVGDELVLEVADGEGETVASEVGEQMRGVCSLLVPLDVSIVCGEFGGPIW